MSRAKELLILIEKNEGISLDKMARLISQSLEDKFSIGPVVVDKDENKRIIGFKFDAGYSKISKKVSSNRILLLRTEIGTVKLRVNKEGEGMTIYYYAKDN